MRSLRRVAVPLFAYLAITVVLPVANGAFARDGFLRHAASVLLGCAVVIALAAIVDRWRSR